MAALMTYAVTHPWASWSFLLRWRFACDLDDLEPPDLASEACHVHLQLLQLVLIPAREIVRFLDGIAYVN